MIKTIFIVIVVFILSELILITYAQTQPWKKLPSPVTGTLRFVSFVDSLTGWAAGEAGTIIRTTDGGSSWDVQNSTVQTFIMDVFFIDQNFGWAISLRDEFPFNSILLKTTTGGDNWFADDFPDSVGLVRTIFFFDSLNGFAGGSNISRTTDGGSSWIGTNVDSSLVSDFPIYNFNFFNREFGYACGGRIDVAGVIWKTSNSGLNWTAQEVSADEVFDIFIFDSLNAVTLSGDPEALFPIVKLKTTNAGETWVYSELPFVGLSYAIEFRTFNEGWSASGEKFLLTTDHGATWDEFETPDSTTIYDLQFINARTGYAVGANGVILKIDPTLVSIEKETILPDEFVLYQNYPNPFNPSTSIRFQIANFGFVSLTVYDVLGNEVATLVNEEKQPGVYEVEFNLPAGKQGTSSGVYFYQLKAGSFIQSNKMLYLK
jgi:photosystem II stability/assembly factor-like uncharacterized protein